MWYLEEKNNFLKPLNNRIPATRVKWNELSKINKLFVSDRTKKWNFKLTHIMYWRLNFKKKNSFYKRI